ncbi:MAG: hypothetical protein ACYSW1_19980 [Planctomycetota bacterium]
MTPRTGAARGTIADRSCAALVTSILVFAVGSAAARPEKIRPGHSYYSDGARVEGLVRDIGDEKNYEEVYQRYRYYEAVYDEAGRVVLFKEYVRGDVIRTEEYRYGAEGALVERVVRKAGEPPESTAVDRAENNADSEGVP